MKVIIYHTTGLINSPKKLSTEEYGHKIEIDHRGVKVTVTEIGDKIVVETTNESK